MVHLRAFFGVAAFALVIPHASFATSNFTTINAVSQSPGEFKLPNLDLATLLYSQNKTFEALLEVREKAPFLTEHIASSKRAVFNLIFLAKANAVWTEEHPIMVLLGKIATDVRHIELSLRASTMFIDIASTATLAIYDVLELVLRELHRGGRVVSQEVQRLPQGKLREVEIGLRAIMDVASNIFDSEVLAYEGTCSNAIDSIIQIALTTQALDTHVAHLKTIILTSYPHVLPMEADANIFSTIASILRERQLDFSKVDEEALQDLTRWAAEFTVGAIEVGTKDLGLIDQEIKDMLMPVDASQQQAWDVKVDRFARV